ncbi:MAG: hypothetical protein L0099_11590 [Acidobacteria bacterium]|nr:hypothetical protein [Acidobacteriota bacterium]
MVAVAQQAAPPGAAQLGLRHFPRGQHGLEPLRVDFHRLDVERPRRLQRVTVHVARLDDDHQRLVAGALVFVVAAGLPAQHDLANGVRLGGFFDGGRGDRLADAA